MSDIQSGLDLRASQQWERVVDDLLKTEARRDTPYDKLYQASAKTAWSADAVTTDMSLDSANPLGLPRFFYPLFGVLNWDAKPAHDQAAEMRLFQGWQISQVLFGEHAALHVSAKLLTMEIESDVRIALAAQVCDEARHVRTFTRLLVNDMAERHRPSRNLDAIVKDILEFSESDMVVLGMQIVIEGFALGVFRSIEAYSANSNIKELFRRVMQDEARHFSFGRSFLRTRFRELSGAQRLVREQFIIETVESLNDHLLASDLLADLSAGRDADARRAIQSAPTMQAMRRMLFRQVVPTVQAIGMMTDRVRACFDRLGILHYSSFVSLDQSVAQGRNDVDD